MELRCLVHLSFLRQAELGWKWFVVFAFHEPRFKRYRKLLAQRTTDIEYNRVIEQAAPFGTDA